MQPSLFAAGILLVVASAQAQTAANTLTEAESRDGWKLLWDGKTTAGWRSIRSNELPGEWNQLQIVVKGNHVEHWLNGELVLDYGRSSPEFKAHFEASKFRKDPGFCERKSGHILLQDHKSVVSFRNLKIHELPAN